MFVEAVMGRDCRKRLVAASNGTLSEKQAQELLDEVIEEAKKRVDQDVDIDDAIAAEIAERKIITAEESREQKRRTLMNLAKRNEILTRVTANIDDEGMTVRKALQALTVGVNGQAKLGRYSLDFNIKSLEHKYMAAVASELERKDLLRVFNSRKISEEVEKELYQLSLDNGQPGVTKSVEALEIAKIISTVNEGLRLRANRAGARIGKLEGFTASQTHDRSRIRKTGYNKWKEDILGLIDEDQTFGKGLTKKEKETKLKSIYDVITTGITRAGQQSEKLFEFKGPSNLAKRISRERVIHFKNADASIEYRKKFGTNDFNSGVFGGIRNMTRDIAMMEMFGTNPDAMFSRILDDVSQKYRGNEKAMRRFSKEAIQDFYNTSTGKNDIPEVPSVARFGMGLRAIQNMANLGGAVISALPDVSIKASELHQQGFNLFDAYGISIRDIGRLVETKDRKLFGNSLGVGMDGMIGGVASRVGSDDDIPGRLGRMQRLFFKLNLLEQWTDSQKRGTGFAMSAHLAGLKNKSLKSLDEDTKRLFGNVGINDNDWNIIRKHAVVDFEGRKMIDPSAVEAIPDEVFGRNALRKREILEDKVRGYFIDRADFATITPGAREKAIINLRTKRGTVIGELARVMMQFKSFPIAVLTRTWGSALYSKGKADYVAMANNMIMMTLLGYVASSAKDLAKGREPADLDRADTWGRSLVQGGGLGFAGDILFNDFSQYGRDFTSLAMGPTFGTMDDVFELYSKSVRGEAGAGDAINLFVNNAPGGNLFYARPILNYTLLYQMQEAVNPGYLRRMESRIERDTGQEFIIPPTDFR